MKIMPNRMDRGFSEHQAEYEKKALDVLRSGWYVLGREVAAFEASFADYIGTRACVGLANGLDALIIAFRALGIGAGDEVIVQGNAYIACVMGITINGAVPVFVEPDEYHCLDMSRVEEKITKRTRAILVVHLYGQASDMTSAMEIAKRHKLAVVEDCAQSHGAKWNGRTTGSIGDIGCFSFYPSKNLGAFGDAGAITTNDPALEKKIRTIRNYGSSVRYHNEVVGMNSRLDELQAGLLSVRLTHLDEITAERRALCSRYLAKLNNPLIVLPCIRKNATTVWHQFVIRCGRRAELIDCLNQKEIGTIIHYPIPPHLSEAYAYLGLRKGALPFTERLADEVLSIPLYSGMTEQEQDAVIDALNAFGGKV